MPPTSNPPDPAPIRPKLTPPPDACDAHVDLFGPPERRPDAPDAVRHDHAATPADVVALQDRLGLSRAVLVQTDGFGGDNSRLLDALAEYPKRFRGVVAAPAEVSDAELKRMDGLGVRGVRYDLAGESGAPPAVDPALAARIASLGWHVEAHVDGAKLTDLRPVLAALPCDVVIEHMGRLDAGRGVAHPGFASLLDMLDGGRTWVKLSGPMRLSRQDRMPYGDVDAFARALVARRPDRCLWGSDWPHAGYESVTPDDAKLLDLLPRWVPDEAARNRILVDNPARLYWSPDLRPVGTSGW